MPPEPATSTPAPTATSDNVIRLKAEQALRESEQRYRDLYENAPRAYFLVGMDGQIHMVNTRAVELLAYPRDDLIGRSVIDLYMDTPTGRVQAQRINKRIRAGEEIHGVELDMRGMDGTPVWISLTVRLIRDVEGRLVERRAMVVDITERKQAKEALRVVMALQADGWIWRDTVIWTLYGRYCLPPLMLPVYSTDGGRC